VIHDVDRSLAAWFGRCLPAGTAVRFTSPRPDWLVTPPEPCLLNGFLYEIREDVSGLAGDTYHIRDTDGRVTARRPPTRRYRLRYLLTAWVADNATEPRPTEHELLSAVLAGCVAIQSIPADCLTGSLVDADQLVTLRCAPADETPVGAELSARLDVTTLDLVVVAPLVPTPLAELAPAPSELDLHAEPGTGSARRPEPAVPERRPRGRVTERS
jgi:hypothetical protein